MGSRRRQASASFPRWEGISGKFFFDTRLYHLYFKEVGGADLGESPQNLERLILVRKILRNQHLADATRHTAHMPQNRAMPSGRGNVAGSWL